MVPQSIQLTQQSAHEEIAGSRVLLMLKNLDRFRVLYLIAEGGELTVSELLRHVQMARPYMYQHVRRLQQFGWIRAVRRKGAAKRYACISPELRDVVLRLRTIAVDPEANAALAVQTEATGKPVSSAPP
ncbi:hypothetical protein LYSHEL_21970 [Lysobacter helvus]|uniref:HTH arsR-type domain-containing protein n=3 Tax=Lysobacterales TaxID=135614 RepID=A0ABN6FUQ6_9GAMM|nr:hypothetical protein LYSCAS_21980 [Lysobacter caseinilyticus]BCT96326.1 hypothetical protein LYSHEL_21970 [Lysobacter helvus]